MTPLTLLILRSAVLFLAVVVTGITISNLAQWCALLTTIETPDGPVSVKVRGLVLLWLLVGLLWALFFFLQNVNPECI